MVRKGLEDREVKRGPRRASATSSSRCSCCSSSTAASIPRCAAPTTLDALREMAAGGYVDPDDAAALADAYCFLRKVEHRLQLVDEHQVHAIPESPDAQTRLARTMGYRDTGAADAVDQFFAELGRHQATVRSIHERLYFRPLLEAFAALPSKAAEGDAGPLARPGATEARLGAFGFTEADRARDAVRELTSGLTRSSRLMQQMLPLLLEWLADSPDPDQGLLCLRNLASGSQRSTELASLFRDSPEAARRVCVLVGTSRMMADAVLHNPDLIARLPDFEQLRTRPKAELVESARKALAWRSDVEERQAGLRRWKERHLVGITARDVLGEADVATVGRDVSALAEASLEAALEALEPAAALRRDRARPVRGCGAVVRERPRRAVRLRGRDACRLRCSGEARDRTPSVRRWSDAIGPAVGGRRGPASGGQARPARAQRRGLRDVLLPLGARVGATGDDPSATGRR